MVIHMPFSSDNRGLLEPPVGLVALLCVCLGLSLYAVAVADAIETNEPDRAGPVLDAVMADIAPNGVIKPASIEPPLDNVPPGYTVQLHVETATETWAIGPQSPPGSHSASTPVSVQVAPGVRNAGTLTMEVWEDE